MEGPRTGAAAPCPKLPLGSYVSKYKDARTLGVSIYHCFFDMVWGQVLLIWGLVPSPCDVPSTELRDQAKFGKPLKAITFDVCLRVQSNVTKYGVYGVSVLEIVIVVWVDTLYLSTWTLKVRAPAVTKNCGNASSFSRFLEST